MKQSPNSKEKGFTLIELMIVVSIIGILASVAIPAFLKFIRKSKTSEASINLQAISNGANSWFDAEHANSGGDPLAKHFPSTSSPTNVGASTSQNPNVAPCVATGTPQYAKNAGRWGTEPWKSLKFGINSAHYFRYQYGTAGTGKSSKYFVAASADLDCDNSHSTFYLFATVNSITGEVERSNVVITDALE